MITIVVATDCKLGIARNGIIPWRLPADLAWFNKITTTSRFFGIQQNAIIMGRKTWESLPTRPLKDRHNIVISRTKIDGVTTVASLDEAFDFCSDNCLEIFVIGGEQVYNDVIKNHYKDISNIYLTMIDHDYNCDQFFPSLDDFQLNDQSYGISEYDKISKIDIMMNIRHYCRLTKLETSISAQLVQNSGEQGYLQLLEDILNRGHIRKTRNGPTLSTFGGQLDFDLADGFPLLTTKKMFVRGIFEELKFFLLGQTDTNILMDNGVNIWKGNTTREFLDSHGLSHYSVGDMGPMYGFQLRHYGAIYHGPDDYSGQGVDVFMKCIELLKTDPYSRRIIMTTYNPAQAVEGVLYPCHGISIQFYVDGDDRLSCKMMQRSVDSFLGLPFNIASYAMLIYIVIELVNNSTDYAGPKLTPGKLYITLGDTHIYQSHVDAVMTQLDRQPYTFPQLYFKNPIHNVSDLCWSDVIISGYESHPSIPAKMIV